jgi:hypothetical protein
MDTTMHRCNHKWQYIDTWLNNTISKTVKHNQGPEWLNEVGSWITQQLIQAYHQYGVISLRLCKLQKGWTRLATASDKIY